MFSVRQLLLPCLGLAVLVSSSSKAFAHKLLVDPRAIDGRLRVEAFFDDDTPAQKARITVENEKREIVAEGLTDERGTWDHPLPEPGKYTIRAESVGHVAKERLTVEAEPLPNWKTPTIREERTEIPWLRASIGLAAIAVLSGSFWWVRKSRR